MSTTLQTTTSKSIEKPASAQLLSTVPRGARVQLSHIVAGRRLARRLAELGLTPGVTLQVLHDNGGPMLIAVRGARLALGRGMTEKIMVTAPEEQHD